MKTELTNERKLIDDAFIGKKVLVRTFSAGVHFGTLDAKHVQTAILQDSRRIYSWAGAATLSQIAVDGSKRIDECKIAKMVPFISLERVIEVIPLSDKAIDILYGAKEWEI